LGWLVVDAASRARSPVNVQTAHQRSVSKRKKDFSSVAKNLLEDIGPLPVLILKTSTQLEWIED
jgi:hypothetical protein